MLSSLAAFLISYLPARYWTRFPALPVAAVAPVGALLTLLVAGVLGIGAFMTYADGMMADTGTLQIAIAERQVRGELPETTVVSTGPMAVALLSPLAFMFLTPQGLAATYFVFASFVRSLAWATDAAIGDPVLTSIDSLVGATAKRLRTSIDRGARAQAEGASVPDRLYEGAWAGLATADYVVVASRRKPDWVRGTTIMTADDCFTLGEPFDRQTPDGLRTIYPLTKQRITDVIRGAVKYDLPPLRRAPKRSA